MCELELPELNCCKGVHNLKDMAKCILKVSIQGDIHCALEDARIATALFAFDQKDLTNIRVRNNLFHKM